MIIQVATMDRLYISPEKGLEWTDWQHSCERGITQLDSLNSNTPNPLTGNLVSIEKASNLAYRQKLAELHFNKAIEEQQEQESSSIRS
jgi:hypothetical protein